MEILEESLLEYTGALVLVTHDRFMMDRISSQVLGLNGLGGTGHFADCAQWEEWQRTQSVPEERTPAADSRPAQARKKLSYLEAREYATIEERIAAVDEELRRKRLAIEDPSIASDGPRLMELAAEIEQLEKGVDNLYARWSELEQKKELG